MSGSDNSTVNSDRIDDRAALPPVSRYDLLLAVIPLAFLASLTLGTVLAIPVRTALVGALVVGTLALVDALFINPPRGAGGQ